MRLTCLLGLAALLSLAAACETTQPNQYQGPGPDAPANSEPTPEPTEPDTRTQEERDLAQGAYTVLAVNCWHCHGKPGWKAYGEVAPIDWILDYDKLIENNLVIPGLPRKSRLVYVIEVLGKMPRKFDYDGKPTLEAELDEADLQTLKDWIKIGAPRWRE
jgi:hypothetical protein